MNKKVLVGIGVAAALLAVLALSVMATEWDEYATNESPENIDFIGTVDEDGVMNQNSLNYALFENYGPLLLILALLMFGAMIGGVCIAREESEHDDTD
jgi:NADH:ubiquinone oxidoreductase subunit 6 (subunit J)